MSIELQIEARSVVRADRDLCRILFANLVRNACSYTQRSPVKLVLSSDGPAIRLRDNGVGIPPESVEAVFEDFRRIQPEGLPARNGSGLGLALCRRVARLHEGSIRVASSGPEGTTFEVTL
jgi:signal transduction histidine kinase